MTFSSEVKIHPLLASMDPQHLEQIHHIKTCADLILGQRRRRWADIKPAQVFNLMVEDGSSQQTRSIDPMLFQCWASVEDVLIDSINLRIIFLFSFRWEKSYTISKRTMDSVIITGRGEGGGTTRNYHRQANINLQV